MNQIELTSGLKPAKKMEDVWTIFDPALTMDPRTEYYIQRTDPELQKLSFELKHSDNYTHVFLCGHRGSGKTTELNRLYLDPEIEEKYLPVYMTARTFGSETVHLTHDAILLEMGLKLVEFGESFDLPAQFRKEIENWGKQVVTTYLKDKDARAEVGAKAGAWLAFFKAQLSTRREWKREEKQILEPKVQDLLDILNRMAQDMKNRTGKRLLVMVDDLEKGESDAHRAMHSRLFIENYPLLVQPRFSIIYTLPVYFRGLRDSRIPNDQLYAFSAVRLYDKEDKAQDTPPLKKRKSGYQLMKKFVEKRLQGPEKIFEKGVLDELLRIGGGLFRETARAIREASYMALQEGKQRITKEHARKVYHQIKKEYQPIIRGDAIEILRNVTESTQGWVPGVEPFLQSRAVVEYENDDLWLDLRYVLKPYIKELSTNNK